MLQVAFIFQNSVKTTDVRHFLISSVCTTNVHINYDFIFSKKIYTSIELTCGTLIIKIKISICACSIVSRVFIYASNKPFCSTLIINLGKNSICACHCNQMKTSFARNKYEYKIWIRYLSMNNYIYLLREQR